MAQPVSRRGPQQLCPRHTGQLLAEEQPKHTEPDVVYAAHAAVGWTGGLKDWV